MRLRSFPSDTGKLKGRFLSRICQTPVSDAMNLKMIIEDIVCHQSYFKLGLTLGFGETAREPELYKGTRQPLLYCWRKVFKLVGKMCDE